MSTKAPRAGGLARDEDNASASLRAKVVGYHFDISFTPHWPEVLPLVVQRARLLKYTVSDEATELEPLASTITFAGTRWFRFTQGGLRFDVYEHRRALKGNLVQHAGSVDWQGTYRFGLAHPELLLGGEEAEFHSQVAVGVWLRAGTLLLLPVAPGQGRAGSIGEEVLVSFDAWHALEKLLQLSVDAVTGERTDGNLGGTDPSPSWAPGFSLRFRDDADNLRAVLRHPRMIVTASLQPIVEQDEP